MQHLVTWSCMSVCVTVCVCVCVLLRMLSPSIVPALAVQNRLQVVDDYFLGNPDLRFNDIHP